LNKFKQYLYRYELLELINRVLVMIDPELSVDPKADPKESTRNLVEFLKVVQFPYSSEK